MNVTMVLLVILVAAALYTDMKGSRIPNWLTVSGACAGFASGLLLHGVQGLLNAAAGCASGFGMMLLFHLFGALGAGDVKLFGGIGAIAGIWFTLSIAVYSVLFAGLIGVIVLIARRQLLHKAAFLWTILFQLLFLKRMEILQSVQKERELIRFPFMLAVLPGLLAAIWDKAQ